MSDLIGPEKVISIWNHFQLLLNEGKIIARKEPKRLKPLQIFPNGLFQERLLNRPRFFENQRFHGSDTL